MHWVLVIKTLRDDILYAANLLKQGRLVAIPTDTVYGLAADAKNPDAVRRIFKTKGRPADRPLSVLIAGASQISDWTTQCPTGARKLAQAFWPGALTIILPKHKDVLDEVSGGLSTIGLRCPNHPIALSLLKAFGSGVAAPSANISGRISPTLAAHVQEELGNQVDYILDGGACEVGIESTIVDYSSGQPVIKRLGSVGIEQIESVVGEKVILEDSKNSFNNQNQHYALNTPIKMLSWAEIRQRIEHEPQQTVAVMALSNSPSLNLNETFIVRMPLTIERYANRLYKELRRLDALNIDEILIESPPLTTEWAPITDRLRQAVQASGKTKP